MNVLVMNVLVMNAILMIAMLMMVIMVILIELSVWTMFGTRLLRFCQSRTYLKIHNDIAPQGFKNLDTMKF